LGCNSSNLLPIFPSLSIYIGRKLIFQNGIANSRKVIILMFNPCLIKSKRSQAIRHGVNGKEEKQSLQLDDINLFLKRRVMSSQKFLINLAGAQDFIMFNIRSSFLGHLDSLTHFF
jgi:hypothetical protein